MKRIYKLLMLASVVSLASCDLDLYPETGYNEGNVKVDENTESQYNTREDMLGLRNSIYNSWAKGVQEYGYEDYLIYTECRADNAYCGTNTAEIMNIEANKQDGENVNVRRDWNYYLSQMSNANNIICNVDRVMKLDPTLTQAEANEWSAEAKCWKAWALFQMSRLWGRVPVINTIPPAITSENIEEVYFEYFPPQEDLEVVYAQLVEDLEFAIQYAPDVDQSNKFVFTKAFAKGLLARIYAEAPIRNWQKVAELCSSIEKDYGYELCDDYGEMWAYDETDAVRNTKESIFEVQWSRGSGNWVFMMFHRNAYNPSDSYSWAKWVTPSRDLIEAYDAQGDTERKNTSIIIDECGWSNYYPNYEYAFMHKVPTNASSIILMRLGEIKLLHAEALACTGDLAGATKLVNEIRTRAGIKPINQPANEYDMVSAILDERRLELAFEGHRLYDRIRNQKDIDRKFPGAHPWEVVSYDDNRLQYPIPNNEWTVSGIQQNDGY
jgi:hypothetical protein